MSYFVGINLKINFRLRFSAKMKGVRDVLRSKKAHENENLLNISIKDINSDEKLGCSQSLWFKV